MHDLYDRLLHQTFTRGINSANADYLSPADSLDAVGLRCRVIIVTGEEETGFPNGEASLIRQVTSIQVRYGELAALGVERPQEAAVFRIHAPGHELDGALFQIDGAPMRLDTARKVWTCYVSAPDQDIA